MVIWPFGGSGSNSNSSSRNTHSIDYDSVKIPCLCDGGHDVLYDDKAPPGAMVNYLNQIDGVSFSSDYITCTFCNGDVRVEVDELDEETRERFFKMCGVEDININHKVDEEVVCACGSETVRLIRTVQGGNSRGGRQKRSTDNKTKWYIWCDNCDRSGACEERHVTSTNLNATGAVFDARSWINVSGCLVQIGDED